MLRKVCPEKIFETVNRRPPWPSRRSIRYSCPRDQYSLIRSEQHPSSGGRVGHTTKPVLDVFFVSLSLHPPSPSNSNHLRLPLIARFCIYHCTRLQWPNAINSLQLLGFDLAISFDLFRRFEWQQRNRMCANRVYTPFSNYATELGWLPRAFDTFVSFAPTWPRFGKTGNVEVAGLICSGFGVLGFFQLWVF